MGSAEAPDPIPKNPTFTSFPFELEVSCARRAQNFNLNNADFVLLRHFVVVCRSSSFNCESIYLRGCSFDFAYSQLLVI